MFRSLNEMNIKSLGTPLILQIDSKPRVEGQQKVQPRESSERDADGRQQQADEGLKRHLTDEEILEAMDKLRQLPGVQNNNLRVRLVTEAGIKRVFIEDPEGRVVRRLSESQLWAAVQHLDKSTGQLINKAM
jgi:hypothetical protein